jgi:pilus assembly protein CpaF
MNIGMINPIEYLYYQHREVTITAEMSRTDADKLQRLIEQTKYFLRDYHNDDFVKAIVEEGSRNRIRYYISDFIKEQHEYTFSIEMNEVISIIHQEITEMGVLQPALNNPRITSIEINGPNEVIVEEGGIPTYRPDIQFQSNDHIYRTIDKMLMPMGKTLTASEPIIDSNYRGFRINVVADVSKGGVSLDHPIISIRKFPPDVYSDQECIEYGNISEEIADFLSHIVPCGPNILLCGGTNSGKTTQLLRLPLYLDPITRIITIEDSAEMMLKKKDSYREYPNIAAFVVKDHEKEKRRYDIARLVKMSLRQNPDWIIVGEVRDEVAAQQTLVAINTGHTVAVTLHANSAREAATRMLQLCGNTRTVASQVATTIDLIIYQENVNGTRVVTDISELVDFEGTEKPVLNRIFKYNYLTNEHQRVGKVKKLNEKILKKKLPQEWVNKWCTET